MEFLKDILGDELYTQVKLCIENYNAENKDNAIKLVNGSGDEKRFEQLEGKIKEERLNSGVIISLLKSGARDVDYLVYRLNKMLEDKGKALSLDEKGAVVNSEEYISYLKEECPDSFFDNKKNIKENALEKGNNPQISYGDIMKMSYNERNKLFNENPEAYKSAIDNY